MSGHKLRSHRQTGKLELHNLIQNRHLLSEKEFNASNRTYVYEFLQPIKLKDNSITPIDFEMQLYQFRRLKFI